MEMAELAIQRTWVWMRSAKVVRPARAFSAVFLYTLIGTIVFMYGQEGMTVVDAVYFMIVTMATVGYGDVAPKTPVLKAFSILWIFVAIILVFPEVTGLVGMPMACCRLRVACCVLRVACCVFRKRPAW